METKFLCCFGLILLSHLLVISAETLQGKASEAVSCFEEDTDYEGHDIYEIPLRGISSPKQCYTICKKDKFCHAWTWTPGMDCYLKDGSAFINRISLQSLSETFANGVQNNGPDLYVKMKKVSGKVSGPKECFTITPFKCYDIGTNFEGYDLLKLEYDEYESPFGCHQKCHETPNCYYWSWDSKTSHCYLKVNDAPLGWKKDETTAGFISGAGVCGNCYEPSTNFVGHDVVRMEAQNVVSAEQCRAFCVRNRNCFFWTWMPQSQRCYLKDKFAYQGRLVDESTQGMVSGAKNCENHGKSTSSNINRQFSRQNETFVDLNNTKMNNGNMYISPTQSKACFNLDTDYIGYDIVKYENGDVSTSQDCQKLCKQHDQCFYWTWDLRSSFCYLKGYEAYKGQTKDTDTVGKISATKLCPCPGF